MFRTHNLISFDELKDEVNKIKEKGIIYFKQEPCILHVACSSLDSAQEFLNKAKLVGWKRSGIMSANTRFMLELISTENLIFPIVKDKRLLVNDEFLKIAVNEANRKLKMVWTKISRLEDMI